MLVRIEQYRRGEVGFPALVDDLQSALTAGEFRDAVFVKDWYARWTPLEIQNAMRGNHVVYEEVAAELSLLESLLRCVLQSS